MSYYPYFHVAPIMPNIRYKNKRQQVYLMPNIRPMVSPRVAPYPPDHAFVDVTRTVVGGAVALGAIGTIGVLGTSFAHVMKP
jgi:hypothetical protein